MPFCATWLASLLLAGCGGGGGGGSEPVATATPAAATVFATAAGATAVDTAASAATDAAPVVFNAPVSVRAGDLVSLQGENFGSNPTVWQLNDDGVRFLPLPLLSGSGGGVLNVKLPADATGAFIVQVVNGSLASAPIKLNAARPYHTDTLHIAAGSPFRLFGRSLVTASGTPTVTVNGLAAKVDLAASDEHMLVVTAPAGLQPGARTTIVVDNHNGSGPATLERPITTGTSTGSDPFGLGTGWADAFAPVAARTVAAASDSRLGSKAVCNGSTDDTPAIQAALNLAASLGGAVVQLPAGTCVTTGTLALPSQVVLKGAGRSATTLRYQAANTGAHALYARNADLLGLLDLTLQIGKAGSETVAVQKNTRLFVKNVGFVLNGGIQMFWSENTNFAFLDSVVTQPANTAMNGPVYFGNEAGFVLKGNTFTYAHGAIAVPRSSDAYIAANRITRDVCSTMNSPDVVHGITFDFAHRVAIWGNTLDVLCGPITNKTRNDGEALLTEGGGGMRTENLGTVTGATATTLTDTANTISASPFAAWGDTALPPNYGVAIVGGKGAGQTRRITAINGQTLTVDTAWGVVPDTTSRYSTFVWGLEKSIIKANVLKDNPRGIWLYQTALRDVDVVANTITEGGGIYVRVGQKVSDKLFTPMFGLRIANNSISNTTRQWSSYLNLNFTRMDLTDFGYAQIGTEVRNNRLQANTPNLVMVQEVRMASEGIEASMQGEGADQSLQPNQVRLLGLVFQGNGCKACSIPLNLGAATASSSLEANTATY